LLTITKVTAIVTGIDAVMAGTVGMGIVMGTVGMGIVMVTVMDTTMIIT